LSPTVEGLLSSDLDRTLLPNGNQPAEPDALDRFRQWASRRGAVQLAYVTGRHRALYQETAAEHALPDPDWLVCNVGTEIYPAGAGEPLGEWSRHLAADFDAEAVREQADALLGEAWPQEAAKQSPLKVSFYLPGEPGDPAAEQERLRRALAERGLSSRVVVSFDEVEGVGLVDFLPPGSGKARALDFLRRHLGLSFERTLFSGDSGNDADALLSGVGGILVGNASETVRRQLRTALESGEHPEARLYFAERPYTAGVLEGMAHYGWEVEP
jgi:hypothetical protein